MNNCEVLIIQKLDGRATPVGLSLTVRIYQFGTTMTYSAQFDGRDYSFIVNGGLFHRLLIKAGLAEPGSKGMRLRVGIFILLTYIPMLVLAAIQGILVPAPGLKVPFVFDVTESTRFLFVGPLLLVAESIIEPWLAQVVRLIHDRLVVKEQLADYDNIISKLIAWRDSNVVEIALFLGTFVWQWLDVFYITPHSGAGTWRLVAATGAPSWAWFWYACFAKPLIRFLWLRWLWRYVIWSCFLCRTSGLNLETEPSHPDRYAGLAFIAIGHAKFAVLAFAFGAQAAGILASQILFDGRTLMSFRYDIILVVLLVVVVFLAPLLAFTGKLLNAKRIGIFEYSALADEYTTAFRAKWIGGGRGDEGLLGTSDIQSLADLGNSYQIINEMRTCFISKNTILTFAVATLLPFAPLLLTVYPFDELLNHILKMVM